MEKSPIAFLSYAHKDDRHGRVSELRTRLVSEVEMATGADFTIFQDRRDIHWGMVWRDRIEKSLDGVTFLIPILTPSFFKSEACRGEVQRFLERERELGRRDLVLPIYYIQADVMHDEALRRGDPLATELYERQYVSWSHLRHKDFENEEVRAALEKLAFQIKAALRRTSQPSPEEIKKPGPPSDVEKVPTSSTESLAEFRIAESSASVQANLLLDRARAALEASKYSTAEELGIQAATHAKNCRPIDGERAIEGFVLAAEAAAELKKPDGFDQHFQNAQDLIGNATTVLAARLYKARGHRYNDAKEFRAAAEAYWEAWRIYDVLSKDATDPAEKRSLENHAGDMAYMGNVMPLE